MEENDMEFPRFIRPVLLKRLRDFPVVLLVGPRQSGKTTLMKEIGKEVGCHYRTFDTIVEQTTAMSDPVGYIKNLKKPVILDEIQRVISLFLPIKEDVDLHPKEKGAYSLTGSANPLVVPTLADALTGRMAVMHLGRCHRGNYWAKKSRFSSLFFQKRSDPSKRSNARKRIVCRRACLGGFPAVIHASDDEARQAWCDEYLSLMLQKDIQDLAQIENVVHMPQLIQILAARTGTLVNYSAFASECNLSTTTLKRYMALLQSLFLVHTLPAWSLNIGKRFVKSPKVYFVDTALLLAALRFDKERLFESPLVLGKVVENFVVNEIMKQVTWVSKQVRVFHCRFQDNRSEVDLISKTGEGRLWPLKLKPPKQWALRIFDILALWKRLWEVGFIEGLFFTLEVTNYLSGKDDGHSLSVLCGISTRQTYPGGLWALRR